MNEKEMYYNRYTGEYFVGTRDFANFFDTYKSTTFMSEDNLLEKSESGRVETFIILDSYEF